MKKRVFCVSLAFAMTILLMGGCTTAGTQGQADADSPGALAQAPGAEAPITPIGQDYTVDVDAYEINLVSIQPQAETYSEASYAYPCQTVSQLDERASLIVTGTVVSTEFFSIRGFACVKIDLDIDRVIKGGLAPGDRISVIMQGGYISVEDYMSAAQTGPRFDDLPKEELPTTYIYQGTPALGFPEPGDKYAYFLAESEDNDKSYWPINADEGSFKSGSDGVYTRINPYDGYVSPDGSEKAIDSFTLDQLQQYFGK